MIKLGQVYVRNPSIWGETYIIREQNPANPKEWKGDLVKDGKKMGCFSWFEDDGGTFKGRTLVGEAEQPTPELDKALAVEPV